MNRVFTFVALLFLIAACTSEIDQGNSRSRGNPSDSKTVFFASTENTSFPETKVYADENLKVLWNVDDRISIFNMNTYNTQYSFNGDDGDTAGEFDLVGDDGEGEEVDYVYAVYPYNEKTSLGTDGVLSMTLPAEQHYKENSFGIGANTMVALTAGNFLAFKNIGGYLSLRLYGDNVSVSRITIKGNNGEKIAGKASIEMPLGGVPTVTMDNSATDEISVVCNPAVKIGEDANNYTDFWFVIPPVSFSLGFTITVTDDKGGVFERATSKALTINRNTLEWMAALEVVPDYTNVNVQFEDANFKAYCVENFDKDGDGEISMAEANAVTVIAVNTEIVASLKGIEYFKNLQFLTCRLNWSTSGIDANGKRYFYNANNEEIFSLLTSLDVSHNTALTSLYCDANQLTSLDVSNNTSLSTLDCRWNMSGITIYIRGGQVFSYFYHDDSAIIAEKGTPIPAGNVTFEDSAFKAYCVEKFDKDGDGEISYGEALIVTSINCESKGIQSLSGIECFTNLTRLYCDSNQLTNLDVSHNTALQDLYCGDNQLTSLDVSNNASLLFLDFYRNQLTGLDVSNNASLQYLDCGRNQLTSLDVSNNTALQALDCFRNQLTSLDVSQNMALTSLNCDHNQLTGLDLSHNTALIDLDCSSNQLSSLDVSNNTVLHQLICDDNPYLKEIWLMAGQIINNLKYDADVAELYRKNSASNNSIPFVDPTVKAICVAKWDRNGDGELSYSEAASVTSIKGAFGNIKTFKSFDEFQYFSNVTSIPDETFKDWQIESIILPLGLKEIGHYAFQNCSRLTSITIPENVTTIQACAFQGCTSITSIIIPATITSIGSYTFSNCTNLTSVTIPESVESIDMYSFSFCTSLTSVNIPETVIYIGDGAFKGCSNLTSINIPNGMTSIQSEVFRGCSSLGSISIPESVTSIGDSAFSSCSGLSSVSIPISVSSTGNHAFAYCTGLTSITIPNSVTTIDIGSFSECTSLTSVTIPESVTIIESGAFSRCTGLSSISIPESVTSIGQGAFAECTGLNSIIIPDSVSSISQDTFFGCTNLESITISESVTAIESGAFYGCTSLSSVILPHNLSFIEYAAFYGCSNLTSITIPENVLCIEDYAFDNLTDVRILATTPPSINDWPFLGRCLIYVPAESVDVYKIAPGWSAYADRIFAIIE